MATRYFRLGGDGSPTTTRSFAVPKMPSFSLPSLHIPTLLPHRIRRKFRSTRSKIRARQTPTSSLASLQTSWDPRESLRALRTHHWSAYDLQYILLAAVALFCLYIRPTPSPLLKILGSVGFLSLLLPPITRQFFLPFLPIAGWLILFVSCGVLPSALRAPIWVRVLPAMENILYGANLSNILSAHKTTAFSVLAWLPYGLAHFGAPFVCTGAMFLFGPPGTAPVFAKAFGYMNLAGVLIQLFLPCSPPWYENMYGLAPADYSMHGSPAGLEAIDILFHIKLYTNTFTNSPVVFGAFPSLHSGCATIEVLFMSHTFPRLRPLFLVYGAWLWWATMYLSHHYAIDLVAGSLISGVAYFTAKALWLPRLQPGKTFRWDYDYVEIGEPLEEFAGSSGGVDFEGLPQGDSDEWTIGSSSSFSSSSRQHSRDHSLGGRSPVEGGEEQWEGETLASVSDHEDGGYKV